MLLGKKAAISRAVGAVSAASVRCAGWIAVKGRATNGKPRGLFALGPMASRMRFPACSRATGSSNRSSPDVLVAFASEAEGTILNSARVTEPVLAVRLGQTTDSLWLSSLVY